MMYSIDSEGGSLELQPLNTSEAKSTVRPATIPIVTGRLVIFRHDFMSYSYQPLGNSNLALQAWVMTEPQEVRIRELENPPNASSEAWNDRAFGTIHVMAAMERFPVGCYGADKVWTMFFAGTDGQTEWPASRMEVEPYYMETPDATHYGKTDTKHGSFADYDHLVCFNNAIFNITEEEAKFIEPAQRWVLETGYECLHKAGYTIQSVQNQHIGSFIGDYGNEWVQVNPSFVFNPSPAHLRAYHEVDNRQITASRLSHVLGLRGPVLHVDTACSASLIGLNAACHQMRWDDLGHRPGLDNAICMGLLVMLHPSGWIGQSMTHMLSPQGRCFTFDQSANGQNRGEGCSCVNLQSSWEQGAMDTKGRLAMVAGSSSNQDGKSASLTAPSGPAQQELHRHSLREARVEPADLTFGECHGTGTPLGDAIEYGANRAVFGVKRGSESPHCLVSAKAHLDIWSLAPGSVASSKCA